MAGEVVGVHLAHCCFIHGCKYGDDQLCPVVKGTDDQHYICEECTEMGIKNVDEIKAMKILGIEKCSVCGEYHKSKNPVNMGMVRKL